MVMQSLIFDLVQLPKYWDYQFSKGRQKFGHHFFNVQLVMLLWATGSVSSNNLSAFDVTDSKAREIQVGDATRDARLLMLLPMETR